jgi:hypothetical protein
MQDVALRRRVGQHGFERPVMTAVSLIHGLPDPDRLMRRAAPSVNLPACGGRLAA